MFTSLALLCHREENKKDCICFPSSLNSQRPVKLKGFRMMIAELELSGNQDWRLTTPLYWLVVGGILPLLLTGNVNCIGSGRHNIIIISDYRHDIVYYCVTPQTTVIQTIQTKYNIENTLHQTRLGHTTSSLSPPHNGPVESVDKFATLQSDIGTRGNAPCFLGRNQFNLTTFSEAN